MNKINIVWELRSTTNIPIQLLETLLFIVSGTLPILTPRINGVYILSMISLTASATVLKVYHTLCAHLNLKLEGNFIIGFWRSLISTSQMSGNTPDSTLQILSCQRELFINWSSIIWLTDGMILESLPLMVWEEEAIRLKLLIISVMPSESPEEAIKTTLTSVSLKMKSENT